MRDLEWNYLCERGHHVVGSDPAIGTCPAVLPFGPDGPLPGAKPCGADIEWRMVPYQRNQARPLAYAADPDALAVDIDSALHIYIGDDGSDDAHNDWVAGMVSEVVDLMLGETHLLSGTPVVSDPTDDPPT